MTTDLDFRTAVAEFHNVFGHGERIRPGEWHLSGVNFMTDEILGLYRRPDGHLVEISTGIVPVFGERPRREVRIYGVTFNRHNDELPDDRSGVAHSLAEAKEMADS